MCCTNCVKVWLGAVCKNDCVHEAGCDYKLCELVSVSVGRCCVNCVNGIRYDVQIVWRSLMCCTNCVSVLQWVCLGVAEIVSEAECAVQNCVNVCRWVWLGAVPIVLVTLVMLYRLYGWGWMCCMNCVSGVGCAVHMKVNVLYELSQWVWICCTHCVNEAGCSVQIVCQYVSVSVVEFCTHWVSLSVNIWCGCTKCVSVYQWAWLSVVLTEWAYRWTFDVAVQIVCKHVSLNLTWSAVQGMGD